jgi:GST-like protein
MLTLYENPGWGSAIVEAQLAFYGLPHRLLPAGDVYDDVGARAALASVNPLAQIPTLVLADGQVMTESAAMTLYLADLAGVDRLVPGPGAAERAAFLRWLIFLVAAVYPTCAFGDVPERFVPEDQAEAYQARMIAHRCTQWRVMEAEAVARGGPWFLGARMTAIDLYLATMVHWRPRQAWFAAEAPALYAAASAAAALPVLAGVMQRNFG